MKKQFGTNSASESIQSKPEQSESQIVLQSEINNKVGTVSSTTPVSFRSRGKTYDRTVRQNSWP